LRFDAYLAQGNALLVVKTPADFLGLRAPLQNGESKSPSSASVIGTNASSVAILAACAALYTLSFELVALRSDTVARSDCSPHALFRAAVGAGAGG
jgi:hypothetical protein